MSLPVELRILCQQLSSTPTSQLPYITPTLLRNVLRCRAPLSVAPSSGPKSDAPETSVLVHKLKTQISSLLYGKSAEGRFTAIVLIKAVVEAGGWEILRGTESWVRGLLAVLSKRDAITTKTLSVLSLTSIYMMTHEYQSLVREITTPTLPNFVSSCLNLISSKSPGKALEVPPLLLETVFNSFVVLISRNPAIFRPYARQIRASIRPYLAPTLCDRRFTSAAQIKSARRLAVLLYQTAPKNAGGEEWTKGVRELVKTIHITTDQVYRAVLEDWESAVGYVSQPIDVNQEVQCGAKAEDDLPGWNGIDAGVERLVGLLRLLKEHFKHPTVAIITMPLDTVVDLIGRLISVVPPTSKRLRSEFEGMRLHPAVERNEREGLWAGLENVHIASIKVYGIIAERLQHGFISMSPRCLSQITWLYSTRPHGDALCSAIYQLISKILPLCGSGLEKTAITLMTPVVRGCCKVLQKEEEEEESPSMRQDAAKPVINVASANIDMFLKSKANQLPMARRSSSEVLDAAAGLLPLILWHLPQQHLQAYVRADIDQTAILTHHKEAMLASAMNPYTGKNGKTLPSILPHLCRLFPGDAGVEALLRPRLPVIRESQGSSDFILSPEETLQEGDLMEDVVVIDKISTNNEETPSTTEKPIINEDKPSKEGGTGPFKFSPMPTSDWGGRAMSGDSITDVLKFENLTEQRPTAISPPIIPRKPDASPAEVTMDDENEDSDESVHLTMEMSDSENESIS